MRTWLCLLVSSSSLRPHVTHPHQLHRQLFAGSDDATTTDPTDAGSIITNALIDAAREPLPWERIAQRASGPVLDLSRVR